MHFILVSFSSLIALACMYLVSMAICAEDTGGAWLLAAFAFLFALPALAALARTVRNRRIPGASPDARAEMSPAGIRFVPHWQLMTLIIIALLIMVIAMAVSFFK
ncbi:MAG: hypothetical protein K4571_14645 [Deltaproteobacteria bacterium]